MAHWSYDFGALSAADLTKLKPTEFSQGVEKARDAAVTLIESGAVGKAEKYRVVIRADGGAPSGLLLEVRPDNTPTPPPPAPAPAEPAAPVGPAAATRTKDANKAKGS